MERQLPRPKDLAVDPNVAEAPRTFKYWLQTNYIATLSELRRENDPEINKARIVRSFLSPEIYSYAKDVQTLDEIIAALKLVYVKRKSSIYARHLLVSRKREPGELVYEYLQALRLLAKDCVL